MKFIGLRSAVVGVACAMVPVSPAQAATIYDDVANGPGSGDEWVGDPYCSIQTANDNAVDGGVALSNNVENPPDTMINERRGLPQVVSGDDINAASGTLLGATPDLLVSVAFNDSVLRFDGITGSFVGVFAAGAGLDFPEGLKFGADGNLYVSSFSPTTC